MPLGRWQRVLCGVVVGTVAAGAGLGGLRLWDERRDACIPATGESWSIARQWNEALLDAIRRDLPAPTVHARNLFHVSAAMWDAWAAYDPDAAGVFVDEDHHARDPDVARAEAISYAAYRILEHRYLDSVGASDTIPALDQLMADLCYPVEVVTTDGSTPAALGNRIAASVIASGRDDGANEDAGYLAPDYAPVNPPLVVAEAERVRLTDPNRWQPLQLEFMISQNGIPLEHGVQEFIGPHWGHVDGFALPDDPGDGLPMDPGPPPLLGDPRTDDEFKDAVVEVIAFSSLLDPQDNEVVDASPGAIGNAPLASYDAAGHPMNPVTGEPYEPHLLPRADHLRAVAVYWADGPGSETPPGHWHKLANDVSDRLDPDLRIGREGPAVDRLEWDVKLYLALSGANHDAAIAAWGTKGHYDYARPISMVRHMGGLGQSSDPDAGSFHPDGLPLVPDLVEVITDDTTAPGERHDHLAGHEGEIAVRSWVAPDDPEHELGEVAWVRAIEWNTYQLDTFVTPSFAAYVSGHSTFSRASAEVLTAITGSRFAPGGLWSSPVPGELFEVEAAPDPPVVLQWATYEDAADQAGISRLYGGIHVRADDLAGRRIGAACGLAAWELAQRYYTGRVRAGA
jgi:hypothetical protein